MGRFSRICGACFISFILLHSFIFVFASNDSALEDKYNENLSVEESTSSYNSFKQDNSNIIVQIEMPQETLEEPIIEEIEITSKSISSSETNGFKAVMLDLIGDYDMITKEYTYTSNNGYTSKQVTTESDYVWWFSCSIFALVLYCLFKMVGVIVLGRK